MRAGALRHKIMFQSPPHGKDAYGIPATEWTDFREAWASIETMKSFDKAQANAVFPGADCTIATRYIPGVTSSMRIVGPDGTIYSIFGTPNNVDGRNREMILTCQAGLKNS